MFIEISHPVVFAWQGPGLVANEILNALWNIEGKDGEGKDGEGKSGMDRCSLNKNSYRRQ
jgi:hypothetical protein